MQSGQMAARRRKSSDKPKDLGKVPVVEFSCIVLLFFLCWSISNRVLTSAVSSALKVEIASTGILEISKDVTGVIIRKERVYMSPASGVVNVVATDMERHAAGTPIMVVGQETVRLEDAGLVSYTLTGSEGVFSKDDPGSIIDFLSSTTDEPNQKTIINGQTVSRGDPVFKVIDNSSMFLAFRLAGKELEDLWPGKVVGLRAPGASDPLGEKITWSKVVDIHEDASGDKGLVIIEPGRYMDEYNTMAKLRITFIKRLSRGILIPKSSVFKHKSLGTCVFLFRHSGSIILRVKVEGDNGTSCLVEGLREGERVVTRPDLLLKDSD